MTDSVKTPPVEWVNMMPWDVPPLVVVKVNPAELLGMLRATVNNGYMPTSTGTRKFNSKPTYITGGVDAWLGKRRRHAFDNGSGYYADEADTATNGIYAALHVGMFIIVVKLRTEECWIRHYADDAEFHRWTDQPVALDRVELAKVFDDYM
ncbi:hypothetical protein D3C81_199830 [compost metagenome]